MIILVVLFRFGFFFWWSNAVIIEGAGGERPNKPGLPAVSPPSVLTNSPVI